jgi:hypothetical protein
MVFGYFLPKQKVARSPQRRAEPARGIPIKPHWIPVFAGKTKVRDSGIRRINDQEHRQ